jgi:mRNA interferase MazF
MNKGDIVLLPFPFTDLTGNKVRPAVVLVTTHDSVLVCFLTTQLKWQDEFDILVEPSNSNGLKRTSLIRLNKFATIDKDLVIGLLGTLEKVYIESVNQKLRAFLKLEQ